MVSIAAEQVAKDVITEVRNGKIPNLQVIQKKHGYSPQSAKAMKATRTESYKEVMKPLVQQLEEERQAILDRLPAVRDKAKYRDLTDGLDKVTKTIQLLTGKATENVAIAVLSDEDKEKLDRLLDDK